jgi:hypothetical protein
MRVSQSDVLLNDSHERTFWRDICRDGVIGEEGQDEGAQHASHISLLYFFLFLSVCPVRVCVPGFGSALG